jgi:hypothetical protein
MYDHTLEEMADAISKELHVNNNDVLSILNHYWQDKIAHVWQVDDMLECARNNGKPITRADAAGLLHNVFDHHDSSMGITWTSLDVALEDYHFTLKTWPAEKYNEVHGIFKVWRKGAPMSHQFGIYPNQMDGNLPGALELAKSMARETPDTPIFIGLETDVEEETTPWLTVILTADAAEPLIEENEEEACTP